MDLSDLGGDHDRNAGEGRQAVIASLEGSQRSIAQEVPFSMPKSVQVSLAVIAGALVVIVILGAFALGSSFGGRSTYGPGMMGGYAPPAAGSTAGPGTAWAGPGTMGGHGMMGGAWGWPNITTQQTGAGPGDAGFVPGNSASPRVIRIVAGPAYAFTPSSITVQRGETVTFVVTSVGPLTHEFMVGPAEAVATDSSTGTAEIDGITMMQTKSLTYTFDGPGPYAFACHETGHYENGMRGTITVVG